MLHIDENSHLNVFLLSSCNRFNFTFLAIWLVEQKCGSTFALLVLSGASAEDVAFIFSFLFTEPDFENLSLPVPTTKQAVWVF